MIAEVKTYTSSPTFSQIPHMELIVYLYARSNLRQSMTMIFWQRAGRR